jgi:hypothetical protein
MNSITSVFAGDILTNIDIFRQEDATTQSHRKHIIVVKQSLRKEIVAWGMYKCYIYRETMTP